MKFEHTFLAGFTKDKKKTRKKSKGQKPKYSNVLMKHLLNFDHKTKYKFSKKKKNQLFFIKSNNRYEYTY